eukprot:scaffold77124_cov57-Phaeocystis_antarctica.AAC.2
MVPTLASLPCRATAASNARSAPAWAHVNDMALSSSCVVLRLSCSTRRLTRPLRRAASLSQNTSKANRTRHGRHRGRPRTHRVEKNLVGFLSPFRTLARNVSAPANADLGGLAMPPKGAKKTAVAEAPVAAAPVAEASDEPQQVIVPGANEWDAPRIYIKPKEQVSPPPLSPPPLSPTLLHTAVPC